MKNSGESRRRLGRLVGLILIFILLGAATAPAGRTIYVNGPVLTMDDHDRVADAVVVQGGRTIFVGGRDEALAYDNGLARVVDLEGRAMIPGFVDAHSHFPGTGLDAFMVDLNSPPIGHIHNLEELKQALREKARETKPGKWVAGMGYDDTMLAEQRHPTRQDLDEVSTEHPIFITHISGHLAVANSRALEIAGINRDTPDPEGGRFRRDPKTGEPDGVLEETAVDYMMTFYPTPSAPDLYRMLKDATQDYLSQGVTTAQNGLAQKTYVTILGVASRLGVVPLRLVVWPDDKAGQLMVAGKFKPERLNSARFRVGAIKLIADGSIQGYTGYLTEPYYVIPGDFPKDYRGYPVIEREKLIEEVKEFHCAGYQVAIHGNGDAAIDDILAAFESAQQACPREDARHIIIHAQMAREEQLDKMKELGVIPSFFVLHTYYWGDRHMKIFMGPERARRMSPCRSALERGLPFTIHTDAPVVPMTPLLLVWSAVNRLSSGGQVIGADQRIGVMDALRAVTINGAHQMFLEDDVGSIEPGKRADLVILDRNPLDDPAGIKDLKVMETIIDGKVEYQAP